MGFTEFSNEIDLRGHKAPPNYSEIFGFSSEVYYRQIWNLSEDKQYMSPIKSAVLMKLYKGVPIDYASHLLAKEFRHRDLAAHFRDTILPEPRRIPHNSLDPHDKKLQRVGYEPLPKALMIFERDIWPGLIGESRVKDVFHHFDFASDEDAQNAFRAVNIVADMISKTSTHKVKDVIFDSQRWQNTEHWLGLCAGTFRILTSFLSRPGDVPLGQNDFKRFKNIMANFFTMRTALELKTNCWARFQLEGALSKKELSRVSTEIDFAGILRSGISSEEMTVNGKLILFLAQSRLSSRFSEILFGPSDGGNIFLDDHLVGLPTPEFNPFDPKCKPELKRVAPFVARANGIMDILQCFWDYPVMSYGMMILSEQEHLLLVKDLMDVVNNCASETNVLAANTNEQIGACVEGFWKQHVLAH